MPVQGSSIPGRSGTEGHAMATARQTARHTERGTGAQLDRAVKEFLKAVPVDHLHERLTALEKWFSRVEKEVRRSGLRVGRAAAETARIAVMGPPPTARPRVTRTGTAAHRTR
jgi:hypothetical protein